MGDSEQILEQSITWSDVEGKLRDALKTESRFGSQKKALVIGVEQSYSGLIGRLHLDWTPPHEDLPNTVIIKIPSCERLKQMSSQLKSEGCDVEGKSVDVVMEEMQKSIKDVHDTENSFYELVHSHTLPFKVPQTYVREASGPGDNYGYILMADQGEDSIVYPLGVNFTVDEVIQVLDAVSEVHAYSIKHAECFKSIHPNKFIDNLVQAHDERSSPLVLLKDLKMRYKEKLGNTIDEIIKNIDEIFNKNTINELNAKFGMQPTLAHCELWTQNLIWKEHDKKRELAAIIDWECVHEGNPSEDIAFMIASSLSADDRHQHADTILKHYYDHLTELLQQQPPFTLKQLTDSFNHVYKFSMLMVAVCAVMLTEMQEKNSPEELKKQYVDTATQKMIDLFEDILQLHKLSKQS